MTTTISSYEVSTGQGGTALVYVPTQEEIEDLLVGDEVPGCFGIGQITKVFARGEDTNGKAYICFYSTWGSENSEMSGSLKESELVRSMETTKWFDSATCDRIERDIQEERESV